jgi:hypothetical protein
MTNKVRLSTKTWGKPVVTKKNFSGTSQMTHYQQQTQHALLKVLDFFVKVVAPNVTLLQKHLLVQMECKWKW